MTNKLKLSLILAIALGSLVVFAASSKSQNAEKNLEVFKAEEAEESARDIASSKSGKDPHKNFLKKHKRLMKVQNWKTDKRGAY